MYVRGARAPKCSNGRVVTTDPVKVVVIPEPEYNPSDCIIDHEDDIDWDNIIATTEADFRAGRFAFNSDDYPTFEEAMTAMRAWIQRIGGEATNRVRCDSSRDVES